MKRRQTLQRDSTTNGGGRKGSLKKEEEADVVENPTCPILKKIAASFVYAKKAVFAVKDGDLAPGSRVIRGKCAVQGSTKSDDKIWFVCSCSFVMHTAPAQCLPCVADARRF